MNILNQPLKINTVTVKNRLVMPPMLTSKCSDNFVTDELIDFYHQRATGGYIGLIIVETLGVSKDGFESKKQISISRDEDIVGLRKLVHTIHEDGSTVFGQLSHAGGKADPVSNGLPTIGPSSSECISVATGKKNITHEMTRSDMERVIRDFRDAALRAKEAGFDGIELHSAHSVLLNQFYSPITNKRVDEYGGTLENRLRFHCELLHAIRDAVGDEYPIGVRLGSIDDNMQGGNTLEDAVAAARILSDAGADFLDISGGLSGFIRKGNTDPGWFSDITASIKRTVDCPVILTGGITNTSQANILLEANVTDFIGVGRPLFKDARWAEKEHKKAGSLCL